MNRVKEEMIKIYNTHTLDWMNYFILDNKITYHHIIKEENGGKVTLENGALLTERAHTYLHIIERYDIEIYNRINELIKEINESRKEPTELMRQRMDLLLCEFELKNADKLIKKREKQGKKRALVAHQNRVKSQLGNNI